MTLSEMKTQLDALNIPVAYRLFLEPTEPPFVVFYEDASNNFMADGTVYKKISDLTIELYTDKKDTSLEAELEAILPAWEKVETWIPEEKLLLNAYSISIELDEAESI